MEMNVFPWWLLKAQGRLKSPPPRPPRERSSGSEPGRVALMGPFIRNLHKREHGSKAGPKRLCLRWVGGGGGMPWNKIL